MNSKYLLSALLTLVGMNFCIGQIKVSLNEFAGTPNQHCFSIDLTNEGQKPLNIAGQNYRLYYNTTNSMLSESSVESLLPVEFTPLVLKQHEKNEDASGFGSLSFEHNLGFINLAVDFKEYSAVKLTLAPAATISTASMCFDGDKPEIIWAQKELTSSYATAFVQVALQDGMHQEGADIVDYRVNYLENKTESGFVLSSKYTPNPFTDRFIAKISGTISEKSSLVIKTVEGKVVATVNLLPSVNEYSVDGSLFSAGVYVCMIQDQFGSVIESSNVIKIQ